ncbi:MAG TPA: SDR family oxidoreductase [Dehalococcoidia bacterium]|nr:SDR family oxidoreductase [Dehalococcoidia bacterium]
MKGELLKMGKLAGKVAVITGAGSGIGRASALLFAKEGAKIVVADFVPPGGHETVKMIKEAGGDAIFVEVNVSKSAEVQRMILAAVDTYGRLDIMFNNAGIQGKFIMTADLAEEAWNSIVATNLTGAFLGSKYAIQVMLKQGGGVIINTASTAGLIGLPGMPAYAASKAGIIQLTKVMALEYADKNIRVNCICPGGIVTPLSRITADPATLKPEDFPPYRHVKAMPRFGDPEEVAKTALYLASDDSSFVTGTVTVVDGGMSAGVAKTPPKKQD